ncbi:MAG TPA: hypothetical protein DC054_13330 [Blastocatellia bacterium]|nr:hypothetical protein [Blastocatellia bacterium]
MATANALNVEDFDPAEWKIGREGRQWRGEEFDKRINQAPEKIEYRGGIFYYDSERLTVLAMLLENLGIDTAVQLGNLEDWKAAIANRERATSRHNED